MSMKLATSYLILIIVFSLFLDYQFVFYIDSCQNETLTYGSILIIFTWFYTKSSASDFGTLQDGNI